jgi:tetratricopeptide (TPR) repeat protein
MIDNGGFEIPEDIKKQADDLRTQSEVNENRRITDLLSAKAQEFAESRYKEVKNKHAKNLQEAQRIRQQMESDLMDGERLIKLKLQAEGVKKEETRRREIEEKRKREEEEKRRYLEEEKKRQIEEETKRVDEEKRRREEEEVRRAEEEKQRREESIRREKEERENRIQAMLEQAKIFFNEGNYDLAMIETAKALVNDPVHPDALAFKQKIKEAQTPAPIPDEFQRDERETSKDAEESEPETKTRTPITKIPNIKREKFNKKLLIYSAVAVIAVVAIVFIWKNSHSLFKRTPTIAILPLTSASGVLEDEIMGKGLAGDINMRLSAIKEFKVMGYTSTVAFKKINGDLYKNISNAGFNYILSGTISRSGDSRMIDFRLVDSTNNLIFEKHLIAGPNDLNNISPDVCKEIVGEFSVKIENDFPFRSHTFDPTAYIMYLRGLELLDRKTLESYNNAQQLFDQASQTDNNFVDAFIASGFVSVSKIENNWDIAEKEYQKAEDKLQRALIAAPKSVSAKRNLGLLYTVGRNFKNAYKELNEAISFSPNNPENYIALAKLFIRTGQYTDARDALLKAVELDPLNLEAISMMAGAYQLMGNYHEAYSYYQKVYPLTSDWSSFMLNFVSNTILFDSDLITKYADQFIGMLENNIKMNPQNYRDMYCLARTYQAIGKNSEATPVFEKALKIINSDLTRNPNNSELYIYAALIKTRMGNFNEAVTLANKSLSLNPQNNNLKYKIARMYAVQKNDSLTINYLKKSVNTNFDLGEILDIDFYNVRMKQNFLRTVELKEKQYGE